MRGKIRGGGELESSGIWSEHDNAGRILFAQEMESMRSIETAFTEYNGL